MMHSMIPYRRKCRCSIRRQPMGLSEGVPHLLLDISHLDAYHDGIRHACMRNNCS